jgi:hypothetical protein
MRRRQEALEHAQEEPAGAAFISKPSKYSAVADIQSKIFRSVPSVLFFASPLTASFVARPAIGQIGKLLARISGNPSALPLFSTARKDRGVDRYNEELMNT